MNEFEDDIMATPMDAVREYTRNVGSTRPDSAWILSQYDSWERNPYYSGPPQPHPEDDYDMCDAPPTMEEEVIEHRQRKNEADLGPFLGSDEDVPF